MNVGAGEIVYQDSIHPPDLIMHNPSMVSPDSPLSTPPDSPRRMVSSPSVDVKEEEKKEEESEKGGIVTDQDSAPDDEKKAPIGDEVMSPMEKILAANDANLEIVHLKPVVVNASKKIVAQDENSHDEPPSLSLVEKAKQNLSRQGLSFTEGAEGANLPSLKTISPSKIEVGKELESDGDKAVEADAAEHPSLSRVQEAMQRTSMMVEKHNQRERNVRSDIAMGKAADTMASTPIASVDVDSAVKSSESKLEALQRDIMSLKSSLSDMNIQLKKENYNDIPSTHIPAETSFEKASAVTNDSALVNTMTSHVDDEVRVVASTLTKEKGAPIDGDVTMETTESSMSQDGRHETLTSYRQMTPKKDLQGSDKSAGWLQEELKRRAGVKREINNAIESRGKLGSETDPTMSELPPRFSPPELNSESTMDDEVAAITSNDKRNLDVSDDGQEPPSLSKHNTAGEVSRKLDYGEMDDQPHDETMDELMGPSNASSTYEGFKPVYDYQDIQHEMKKFASQTREALREQSFTDIVVDPSSKVVPATFNSPISVEPSLDDDHTDFQMNAVASSNNAGSISINFAAVEAGKVPKMLISMDSFDGVASGDIFLSLLSENAGRDSTSAAATWADRVHGAIWRARRMRKSNMQAQTTPPPPLLRSGSHTVESVQKAALMHLKRNEIDDAINLVEGIVFAYYSYFERSLNLREENPTTGTGDGAIDFKPYIGMGLHNLGVLNLLKGDYDEAFSYFTRAVENRKSNLGENHPHYISSLVRLSVCQYALNEFAEAHSGLEEALACARRRNSTSLEGRLQVAEILNNLGCLAYMSGQPTTAASYYRESMDIQFGALTDSLYLGNAISGQSISLNISIARANIGFIKLVTKELSVAITALENALMEQQILLKGLDDTLVATLDHLALSNLLSGSQERAALMYNRILTLQQREYGRNDRRCFVTVEKMNMVQGKGIEYEGAIEQLRKTFAVQPAPLKAQKSPSNEKASKLQKSGSKSKKKKGLKGLFKSM